MRCASTASPRPRSATSPPGARGSRPCSSTRWWCPASPWRRTSSSAASRGGPGPLGLVDWRRMREQTRTIMADWGFDVDADAPAPASPSSSGRWSRSPGRWPRAPLPAARRAHRGPGARRRAAPVRPRPPAARVAWRLCTSPTTWRRSSRSAPTSRCCGTDELVLAAPMAEVGKEDLVTSMVGLPNGPGQPPLRRLPPSTPRATRCPRTRPGGQLGRSTSATLPSGVSLTVRGGGGRAHRAAQLGRDHAGPDRGRGGRAGRGREVRAR